MRFQLFTRYLDRIEKQRSRWAKVELLAELFSLLDGVELAAGVYLCQGRLAYTYRPSATVQSRYNKRELMQLLEGRKLSGSPIDGESQILYQLADLYERLHSSAAEVNNWLTGPRTTPAWLVEIYNSMCKSERRWFVRILYGEVLADALIVDALSAMAPPAVGLRDAIQAAYEQSLPDLGRLARTFKESGYNFWTLIEMRPRVGTPLKPQEITRFVSAEEAFKSLGPCYVQPKSNGWQLQVHKNGQAVSLFSRQLDNWSVYLPDVANACRKLAANTCILDSEVVGYDPVSKQVLPREQTLLVPNHRLLVFDILLLDGTDVRSQPYYERYQQLQTLIETSGTGVLTLVPQEFVQRTGELDVLFQQWFKHPDYEGVVVVAPKSRYLANQKTSEKGKLKTYISLDLVVLGYNLSSKNIPSFLVGVLQDGKSTLIAIGLVEGGVIPPDTRATLLELCRQSHAPSRPARVVADVTPHQWVYPWIVVEVVTDGKRTKSDRFLHAGYELHRKTKLYIREDMGVEDADTLTEFLSFTLPPGERVVRKKNSR